MCFDYSGDGTPEVYKEIPRKAAKPHKCEACGETIGKGFLYLYISGVCEGSGFSHRVCRRCCCDTIRVVCHELDEGCDWEDAWPHFADLKEYLLNGSEDQQWALERGFEGSDFQVMGQTLPDAVPASFTFEGWPTGPVIRIRGNIEPKEHAA